MLNKRALAKKFGVSVNAVDNWLLKGLPYCRKGTQGQAYEFDVRVVKAWLKQWPSLAWRAESRATRETRERAEEALQEHFDTCRLENCPTCYPFSYREYNDAASR